MKKKISAKTKRLRRIFFIVAFTAVGIILCQLYWVYFNFQTAKANFNQSATVTLWQSIDTCLLAQNTLPPSLGEMQPSLTFMMKKQANADSAGAAPTFSMKMVTVDVNADQLYWARMLLIRLLSSNENKTLRLDTLTEVYHHQLKGVGITEQFKLAIDTNSRLIRPGQIAALTHIDKRPAVVRAELINKRAFFFKMNFIPALVSTLLIALSAFSLFYMGRIIRKQMQLDTMKTDFVNNIIHELRTPLTILRTSNEAMSSFGASHDEQSLMRYLGINSLVIDDLDKNIERILDFSKIEQGKRTPMLESIDLIFLLKQAQLRFSQVNNAAINISSDEEPFEVVTDKFMIGVIVSNLIDNAIKYSTDQPKIEIVVRRLDNSWQLLIGDEGIGIPKSSIPFIFDKFYRVPTGDVHEIKGYGIGLAYVKQLVVELNGKIEVASEPGKGSVFTITFNA